MRVIGHEHLGQSPLAQWGSDGVTLEQRLKSVLKMMPPPKLFRKLPQHFLHPENGAVTA